MYLLIRSPRSCEVARYNSQTVEFYIVTIRILFPPTWDTISHFSEKTALLSYKIAFLAKTETEKKTISYREHCHDDVQLARF